MYNISPAELYCFLKDKGIEYLYFSTTVKNACSMISCGELLSKHKLSFKKLPMTGIENADFDKTAGLWNKILFYICDLHGYFPRQNKHGPVCFVVSIEFLSEINERDLFISKRNPANWKKRLKNYQIYYSSVDEFSENFDSLIPQRKAHKNIILMRDKKSAVDLNKSLVEIILDKPHDRHLLLTKSKNAILSALENSGLKKIPLRIRECKDFCYCSSNYGEMTTEGLEELFLP